MLNVIQMSVYVFGYVGREAYWLNDLSHRMIDELISQVKIWRNDVDDLELVHIYRLFGWTA